MAVSFATLLNKQLVLFISETVLFIGLLLADFWRISKRQMDGDCVLRRRTRLLQLRFIILALLATIVYFLSDNISVYKLLIIWTLPVFDLGKTLITNKLKPVEMCIQGSELVLNDLENTRKNLTRLAEVRLDGFWDILHLTIANQGTLNLRRKEYDALELKNFIDQCIACSTREVVISDNLTKSYSPD